MLPNKCLIRDKSCESSTNFLHGDLYSHILQDSKQQVEVSNKEKEEISAKLAQAEKTVTEWKSRVNKLEEDNVKLRRALEQSMTRLNRMSVDSDFLVDRLAFWIRLHFIR